MGKWTPNYTDNVLNGKISALITGAINRAAVEKETNITYDEFVNELDTGDAFTTSLIDVLVKELAERHTRPFQNDERRLIAPRTAERLMTLANARLIYRGDRPAHRNHFGRRTYNITELMNYPTTELELDEEENDFGSLLDAATGSAEGARFNTDLFEAYGSHSWSPIARRLGTTPSPPLDEEPLTWRPSGRSPTWAATTASSNNPSTSLARHPSIRRPTRSRMVDFNDWTSRRRSTIRDSVGAQNENPDGGSSPFSLSNNGESAQTVRRFFPTFTRRMERRSDPREDRPGSDDGRLFPLGISWDREWSPTLNTPHVGSETRSTSNTSSTVSEDRPLPRLRRGGVRPPESFYSHQYLWSAPPTTSRQAERAEITTNAHSTTRSPSPSLTEPLVPASPPARVDTSMPLTEPVGYPTPGSIDNESASV